MIFLIGFMGSGKSFLGKMVAESLSLQFYDLDNEIEMKSGLSISEIFDKKGEDFFRKLESNILLNWHKPGIIATGGGVVEAEENRFFLKRKKTIWINTSWGSSYARVINSERPLVKKNSKEKLQKLYYERDVKYDESARYSVSSKFEDLLILIKSII